MIRSYKKQNKVFYRVQVSYTDSKGKRHQKQHSKNLLGNKISSKREAQFLESELLTQLKNQIEDNYSQLSFSNYHENFLKQIKITLANSTVMQYDGDLKKWLTPSFKNKVISTIKKPDVHNFIYHEISSQGATVNTQKRILKSLKRIFEACLEDGIISRNPCAGITVKVPKPPKRVLNTEQVVLLLQEAKRRQHPFYHLWALALLSGMRNGELYALRWRDIDLVSGIVHVSSSWSNKNGLKATKSNKSRIVPISSDLKSLLVQLKNSGPYKENITGLNGFREYVQDLVLPRSSQWSHGEQSRITKSFCETIGITKVKFHDLRATFITSMLAHGVPIPQVMSIAGHAQMSTTNEYLRLAGVTVTGTTESLGYALPKDSKENVLSFKV